MDVSFHKPVIVGRERERQALRAFLERTSEGHGTLVLLSGEAGIGKTTLVDDLIEQARSDGVLVLAGGCYDLTITPPYGPWSEAIRSYRPGGGMPEIPSWFGNLDELEQLGSQTAIFDEVREFFAAIAEHQPLLIVLEDLHWTDPASVDVLRYLSRTLRDVPVMILVTYRDDEPVSEQPIFEAVPALVRESQAERIAIRGWMESDTRDLISSRYRLRSDDEKRLSNHAFRLAEGNPFYTVELLRELESDATLRPQAGGWTLDEVAEAQVPPLVRQVIERRLKRLSDETRSLLEIASVIGHEVRYDLWQSVTGVEVDPLGIAIDEAIAAQLVDELADRYSLRFRHALVRETLYAENNPLALRRLHRCIGELLARQSAPDPDAVADHFRRAGDVRAMEWLLRAGLRARRTAAWFTTIERFSQAAAMLVDNVGRASERGWLLYYAGFSARYINDDHLIEAYFADAEELALVSDDRELLAVVRWQRGVVRCHRGVIGDGLEDMEAARATLEHLFPDRPVPVADERIIAIVERLVSSDAGKDDQHSAQADLPIRTVNMRWGAIAHWLAHAGHFKRANSVAEEVVANIEQAAQVGIMLPTSYGSAYYGLAISHAMLGRPNASRDAFEAGRERAVLEGDYWAASLSALFELCLHRLPYETARPLRRTRLSDEAGEILDRASELSSGTGGLNFCSIVLDYIDGRWADVHQNARPLINQPHLIVFLGSLLIPILARIHRDQGQPTESWALLRNTLPDGVDTVPGSGPCIAALALQRLAIDLSIDVRNLSVATEWLGAHDRWLEWSGAVLGQAEGHLLWARYHLVDSDKNSARERAEKALACASDPRQPLALIAVDRFLGELDTQERHYERAGEHLSAVAKLAEACQAPYEIALTQLAQAELALTTKDAQQARHLLDRAKETFEGLGAKPALERAGRVATMLAMEVQAYPAGLTPREVEVLCLVAEGMSNREIADRLYLSVRTVERHVTNIYGKIEVTNRVDAAAFAREHRLIES